MIVSAVFVLAAGFAFRAVVGHRPQAAGKFSASAVPLAAFGLSGCEHEVESFGWGPPAAESCNRAEGKPAFHIAISNTGAVGAYAPRCLVQANMPDGTPIPDTRVWISLSVAGDPLDGRGPYLDVGGVTSFDWFLPQDPELAIASYQVTCDPVQYQGVVV